MDTRGALRLVLAVLAVVAVAGAIVVVVLPLPNPSVGGTCGPGTSSEAAISAFFDPVSIGAGVEPQAGTEARYQWDAFIGECQSATNARMVTALGLLIIALALSFAVVLMSRPPAVDQASSALPPPGWYPDESQLGSWRWWDGTAWGSLSSPGSETGT